MISNFEMFRTDINHIGSSPLRDMANVSGNKNSVSGKTEKSTFDNMLLSAMEYVNGKQNVTTEVSQKLITDPDSVDVHDVTIAMAEANLSLSMAQSVIDRLIKGWSEITTTR
jgi:flagellar hook-basal body complex protein FliE